jgi:hypothetical protein
MDTEGRYLFLQAVRENWGLMGPGDLRTETYNIFSDGSFVHEKKYNVRDFSNKLHQDIFNGETIETKGMLNQKQMARLLEMIGEDWLDPEIDSSACDGDAWQIKQFYPSGKTKRTAGELQQIYGQPIERVADYICQVCK